MHNVQIGSKRRCVLNYDLRLFPRASHMVISTLSIIAFLLIQLSALQYTKHSNYDVLSSHILFSAAPAAPPRYTVKRFFAPTVTMVSK